MSDSIAMKRHHGLHDSFKGKHLNSSEVWFIDIMEGHIIVHSAGEVAESSPIELTDSRKRESGPGLSI